jgi:tetratricopeptide (TPR) repeat protein
VSSADRRLGVDLFNSCRALLERTDRTPEEDEELLHLAHASAYHWLKALECEPKNRARSEWLCSRVYAVLGRGEPALHHAERCLEHCEAHPDNMEEFDLPFAYEALARAHSVAGKLDDARRFEQESRALAERIADTQDRELVLGDLGTL